MCLCQRVKSLYLKYWSIVLCLLLRRLLSSLRFLLSYTIFSAARFLVFTVFICIHLVPPLTNTYTYILIYIRSFSTIASTPLRRLFLFLAVARSIFKCLPFSRSSTLKCTFRSCAVSLSLRSLRSLFTPYTCSERLEVLESC